MNIPRQYYRPLLYGTWILLAVIQAVFTGLQDDEAYYRIWSFFPARGYFDHPPLVSLFVKGGMYLFPGAIGIRFFFLLFSVLTVYYLEKLLPQKDPLLFFAVLFSIAALQLAGFLATPDILLIFFTALFFYLYQRFTIRHSWLNTLNLGFAAAALLYSKYHGVLVLLFTLLSDFRLFRNPKVYAAGLLAFLLYFPHLRWQYEHDWVSFRYHLVESNVNAYKPVFTLNYIAGEILLAGPLAGFILLPAAFRYKPSNRTEWAMYFTMAGTYLFFLLSSFRGKVEANWPLLALVPVIVLATAYLQEHYSWRRWLFRLLPVTVVLVLAAKLFILADILPVKKIREQYHGWEKWPRQFRAETTGIPVVFNSSYQHAAQYGFHAGGLQLAYSLNNYKSRRNQFDFIPLDQYLLGKPVYFFDGHRPDEYPDKLQTPAGVFGYRYDSAFISFPRIAFIPVSTEINCKRGDSLSIQGAVELPYRYGRFIEEYQGNLKDSIRIAVFNKKGWVKDFMTEAKLSSLRAGGEFRLSIRTDLPAGKYNYLIAVNCGHYPPTRNSKKYRLTIF